MDKNIETSEEKNNRLIAELSQKQKDIQERENKIYIDELLKNGRLFPSQKDEALSILNMATGYDNEMVISLSEGESFESKIKSFLDKMTLINLSMQTTDLDINLNKKQSVWRNENEKDPELLDLQIKTYMRNYNVNYKTAFEHLTK
ncbi:hypothetical protein [Phocoenobacter skyensis]|uniref:Uncharacterized protein n=1 Tax=Phocoenobacter skyensis TaxID=97481 RepID=A0A1H7X3N9_9PAST|nr:hypothetical protein [Pasteurella skyensis]MDP8079582.1 hypothetical protein [Pasteurella skyensis]MDP8085531.1 hypothetical protein [Pasteurella skyensis]QLB21904.1 hypothetical protein A6B44_01250 [Pasteurella skyensis]SEM28271.1 hypothetical protein SAMN05444853_11115 [Pasteurella skyensis]